MKLGLVTYNLARDWDLPTLLENCRRAGIEGVELRTTHAHGVEPELDALQRRDVRALLADAGVTLWGLGTACDLHSPDPAQLRAQIETCQRFCALAADLGAVGVKVRPNDLPADVPAEKTIDQIAGALRVCVASAHAHGVDLWLEVHGRASQHPPVIRQILDRCADSRVGVCWNSNPTDLLDGALQPYFDLLRPEIRSVHVHELWSEHYPYAELFARLRASAYDGFVLCETGTPLPPEAGATFLACYRGLFRALGGA